MATIRKRTLKNGENFRVQIRRKGLPHFSIHFPSQLEAEKWALENEEKYIENPAKYLQMKKKLTHKRSVEFTTKRFQNQAATKEDLMKKYIQ